MESACTTRIEAATLASKAVEDRQGELNAKVEAKYHAIRDEPMKNAVFLSATPFPYHKNLDYANGYLWPAWNHDGGSGPSERDRFYIDNLGYNWRYHRLETPSAEVNQDFMERELNRRLAESGALSGRSLKLDKDYSRDFVELESGAGRKIDNALNAIQDYKGPYDLLNQYIGKAFDYHSRSRLLENLKADDAVARAKKHIALGRKVVVFHGYKTGHTDNPFAFPSKRPPEVISNAPDADAQWSNQVAQFQREFPDVARMNFDRLGNPIDAFTKAFGDRLALFNGDVPKGNRKMSPRPNSVSRKPTSPAFSLRTARASARPTPGSASPSVSHAAARPTSCFSLRPMQRSRTGSTTARI